ncbi:hypothetical protein D3C78_1503790 [compost metagenome]
MGEASYRTVRCRAFGDGSRFHFHTKQTQQAITDGLKTRLPVIPCPGQIDRQLLGNVVIGRYDRPVGPQDGLIHIMSH